MKRYLTIYCYTAMLLLVFSLTTTPANGLNTESTKTFSDTAGTSQYTLILSSPDQVRYNSNWTITARLNVDRLEKLKTFLFYSRLELTIETSTGRTIKTSKTFGFYPLGNFPDRIYAGGYWGPINFTIALAEEDLGIGAGQSVDANIYAKVDIGVFVDQPRRLEPNVLGATLETFQMSVGTVKIVNNEPNPMITYLPFFIGSATGATVFAVLLIRDLYIKKPA